MLPARQIQTVEHARSTAEHLGVSEFSSDPRLRVTVLYTTTEGTLAALRAAGSLARNLGARIALVETEIVPFHFPVDRPPVSIDFLERRHIALVSESGIQAEEVHIEIYLCRDRMQCLRKVLNTPSLVVIGGRRHWWSSREQELERLLRALGHHVIFVDSEARKYAGSFLHSHLRPLLRRVLALHEGV
jgi:hypothetical protein